MIVDLSIMVYLVVGILLNGCPAERATDRVLSGREFHYSSSVVRCKNLPLALMKVPSSYSRKACNSSARVFITNAVTYARTRKTRQPRLLGGVDGGQVRTASTSDRLIDGFSSQEQQAEVSVGRSLHLERLPVVLEHDQLVGGSRGSGRAKGTLALEYVEHGVEVPIATRAHQCVCLAQIGRAHV